MTTTDTPRTDALDFRWGVYSDEIWDLSRQLERELSASKAAVERLKVIVKAQQDELEAISFALGTNEGHSSVDHIVTLRAEVERLQRQLDSLRSQG